MEFLNDSPTSTSTRSPNKPTGASQYYSKRQVSVKKFDPRAVSSAVPDNHVNVKSNVQPPVHWPEKTLLKKDLENKPWYHLSFEEVVELHCGEQLRLEKYGEYNKSFVTKKKHDSSTPMFAFGSVVGQQKSRAKAIATPTKESPASKSKTAANLASNDKSSSKPTVELPKSPEKIAEESIRARRMKVTDLEKELARVNKQVQLLELNAQKEFIEVQQSMEQYEESEKELKILKQRSARAIALSKATIQKLIEKRSTDQSSQKELDKEIKKWEKQYFDNQGSRKNTAKVEKALAAEDRRDEVRRLVRKGLSRFAKQIKQHNFSTHSKKSKITTK